jgi:outer membrane lipoprotein-sorting protein
MRLLAICLGWSLLVGPDARAAVADADLTPVRKWIERASKLKSLEVEFTQERHLKTLNRPLVSHGRMWFKAPGSLRWQLGELPKLIAVQPEKGSDFFVLDPKARLARVFGANAGSPRRSQMLAFLEAGFSQSMERFQQQFRIDKVETRGGTVLVEGQINDRRAAAAVIKVVFLIDQATDRLRQLEVWFRDGSTIVNKFTKVTENAAIPADVFDVSLEGYRIEREG